MDLSSSSKPRSSINCPKCGYEMLPEKAHFCPECGAAILAAPKNPAAQIEVSQEVGRVEGGQVVGVDVGQILGDVTIGSYTVQIGSVHGGVVNLAPPEKRLLLKARSLPVFLLPRRTSGLLDRKVEVATTFLTLQSSSPVEFHGPAGIGKSKLLHHLAHHELTSAFPDGVVHFSEIHHKPVEDFLLDLFDAFYERESDYKPTPVQVRSALQTQRALVVLDDVELERHEVAALMDAAPSCTFLLASTECCLWGDGRAIVLQGLPPNDALALVERELGRPLSAEEQLTATTLCASLNGNPLHLLQLVALVREDGYALKDLATRLQVGSAEEVLKEQSLQACSEQERRVLAVLAAPMGASLGGEHVDALTGIEDVAPVVDRLQQRGLVESHGPRYGLAGSLEGALREEWDLTPWNEQALEHFAEWAEQRRQEPERVAEEADAILGVMEWAAQEERWEGVLRLGLAVEGALIQGGLWGSWATLGERGLQAARALGDKAAEAWHLHQSGTRALCLEDTSTAHADLTEAFHLRESLGDWEGAAVSQHNLEVAGFGGPDGGDHEAESDGSGGGDGGGSSGWFGGGWGGPRLWLGIIGVASALIIFGATMAPSAEQAADSGILPRNDSEILSGDDGGILGGILPEFVQQLFEVEQGESKRAPESPGSAVEKQDGTPVENGGGAPSEPPACTNNGKDDDGDGRLDEEADCEEDTEAPPKGFPKSSPPPPPEPSLSTSPPPPKPAPPPAAPPAAPPAPPVTENNSNQCEPSHATADAGLAHAESTGQCGSQAEDSEAEGGSSIAASPTLDAQTQPLDAQSQEEIEQAPSTAELTK